MLGQLNSLMYPVSKSGYAPGYFDPSTIAQLKLWIDFTDKSSLYNEIDSQTTGISADGDLIGQAVNKVYATSAGPSAIGKFVRAISDARRPELKTGGANGHSYAFFNANNEQLIARFEDGYGRTSSSSLSSAIFNWAGMVTVIVAAATTLNIGTDQVLFNAWAAKFGVVADYQAMYIFKDANNDQPAIQFVDEGGSSGDGTFLGSAGAKINTEAHVYTFRGSTISSQSKIKKDNGNIDIDTWPSVNVSFNNDGSGSEEMASICIGGKNDGNGDPVADASAFQGQIYEVLVYDATIPNLDEINLINQLKSKYGIT